MRRVGNESPTGAGAAAPSARAPQDGLPTPRRHLSALAIWLAIIATVLDISLVSLALPAIASDTGADAHSVTWVVSANQIALTIALLPAARLGDLFGYRRIYLISLTAFMLSSIGCAFTSDVTSLSVARFIQGIGAAGVMALNGALVRFTYPLALLGRGVSYNALVIAVASAIGPVVAAALLSVASWQWLFLVSVPLSLAALLTGLRTLPEGRIIGARFEYSAALLSVVALGGFFLGCADIVEGGVSFRVAGELSVAVGAGIWLFRQQHGRAHPFLPVDLMLLPVLRLSYAVSACSYAAQMMAFVSLPFYLHQRFGFAAPEIGLLIVPWPVAVALAAYLSGKAIERIAPGALGAVGLALLAAGLVALALLSGDPSRLDIGWRVALCGFGFGFFQTPNNRIMLGSAPENRSGGAGAMLAMSRLVGQSLGAVGVAMLFRAAGSVSALPLIIAAALAGCGAALSARRGA